jgi:flavin-dependent dehydrogenase
MTLECIVPQEALRKSIDRPTIFFGYTQWGYAWAFPRGSEVAVGIGSLINRSGRRIKQQFQTFLENLGIHVHLQPSIKGHLIPYGYHLEEPAYGNSVLIGDAAGLVDSLYGEGIFFAQYSGYLAAQAILSCMHSKSGVKDEYIRLLHKHIFPNLKKRRRQRNVLFRCLEFFGHYPVEVFLVFGKRRLVKNIHGSLSDFGGIR